jgi:hypothetical protein
LSLHHYVLGLQSAGSPYAFHTLGSSLAVSIESYVSGRGFPKRMAGEDFYLLNKVAKLGAVWRADGAPILLSGRPSHRVPFGTGPAIRRIQEAENEFKLFDPAVFDALSAVLQAMRTGGPLPHRAILEGLGYRVVERHLHKNRNEAQRLTHLHTWFDGFKTLKFIHQVRDALYPNLAWKTALEAAEWGGKPATSPELALTEMRAGPYATLCGSTPEALGR